MCKFRIGSTLLDTGAKILRSGGCLRSRQYRGVFIRVIHECDALQILRTEIGPGSTFDNLEMGDSPAYHFVVDGSPVFRASNQSAALMPGDSIVFNDEKPYTISNLAPSRSVILTVLFKTSEMEAGT
jgi:hypothetical protein